MVLYHGSNMEVSLPRLLPAQRALDFGSGFYTTSDYQQAEAWAKRSERIRRTGKASVSVYDFKQEAEKELKILRFEKPDKAWLKYVVMNRRGNQTADEIYDLVIGPVANDQTMPTLVLFMDGFLTEEETINRLLPQKLKDQYVFRTEKALSCLTFQKVVEV